MQLLLQSELSFWRLSAIPRCRTRLKQNFDNVLKGRHSIIPSLPYLSESALVKEVYWYAVALLPPVVYSKISFRHAKHLF